MLSTVTSAGANISRRIGGRGTSAPASITNTCSTSGPGTTFATSKTSIPTNCTGTCNTNQTSCKGLKLSGSVIYTIPAGACQNTALSNVTFKQLTALVIT